VDEQKIYNTIRNIIFGIIGYFVIGSLVGLILYSLSEVFFV